MHQYSADSKFLSTAYHELGHAALGIFLGKTLTVIELFGPLPPCNDFEGSTEFVEVRVDDFNDAIMRIGGICAQYYFHDKDNLREHVRYAGADFELVKRFIERTELNDLKRGLLFLRIFKGAIKVLKKLEGPINLALQEFVTITSPSEQTYAPSSLKVQRILAAGL